MQETYLRAIIRLNSFVSNGYIRGAKTGWFTKDQFSFKSSPEVLVALLVHFSEFKTGGIGDRSLSGDHNDPH